MIIDPTLQVDLNQHFTGVFRTPKGESYVAQWVPFVGWIALSRDDGALAHTKASIGPLDTLIDQL